MHGLGKAMQEINVEWPNVATEIVAVRKLLVEMETNDIIESAKELCSTVNITLDKILHALVNSVNNSKQLAVPMLLEELERVFCSENTDILGALEALDPSKPTYLDCTTLSSLVAKFGACLHIFSALLKTECERGRF